MMPGDAARIPPEHSPESWGRREEWLAAVRAQRNGELAENLRMMRTPAARRALVRDYGDFMLLAGLVAAAGYHASGGSLAGMRARTRLPGWVQEHAYYFITAMTFVLMLRQHFRHWMWVLPLMPVAAYLAACVAPDGPLNRYLESLAEINDLAFGGFLAVVVLMVLRMASGPNWEIGMPTTRAVGDFVVLFATVYYICLGIRGNRVYLWWS